MKDMHEQDFLHLFYQDDCLCEGCRRELHARPVTFWLDDLRVESFYPYRGMAKDMLLQYKEWYDEALYPAFFETYIKRIRNRYRGWQVVTLPSLEEDVRRRGFSHMERMVENLNMNAIAPFVKTAGKQQKYVSPRERVENSRTIALRKDHGLQRGNYLLIDDVCTTGATLRQARRLLAPYGRRIRAVTYAYSLALVEKRRANSVEILKERTYTQE